MEKVKLTYFGGNGRAAIIRAILDYAKVPFENEVIDFKEWPKIKNDDSRFEFHQLPILEINGKKMSQSIAQYIYIAKKLDLYGKNIDEQYIIDSLIASNEDFIGLIHSIFRPETDDEKNNPDKYKQLFKEKISFYLRVYEKRYNELGSKKYFLGDKISLADFFIGTTVLDLCDIVKDEDVLSKNAPGLAKLCKSLKENELKGYYEKYYHPRQ